MTESPLIDGLPQYTAYLGDLAGFILLPSHPHHLRSKDVAVLNNARDIHHAFLVPQHLPLELLL